jgi:hypothetical protein
MAAYTYSRLGEVPFQIRLLTLKPAEEWSADLDCDLESTVFESAPRYEALSYTWGDARNRQDILINGKFSTITENLGVALRYIRQKDASRTLWVDALCINQSDVDECSQQVRRMLDIYKRAARVLAWLGAPSDDSDEALTLLTEFGQIMLDIFRNYRSAPDYSNLRPAAMLEKGFDMSSKNWSALWKFWNRPYWTRVWIIQELARFGDLEAICQDSGIDTDGCLIVCGHRCVPFSIHSCAIIYFGAFTPLIRDSFIEHADETIQYLEPLKSFLSDGPIQALGMSVALRISSNNTESSIHNLMRVTRAFKATDVRDKVYALLGISCERKGFLPDYGKSANMVFQDLVKFSIENYQMAATYYQLEVLSGNRYGGHEFGPSWIPEPYGPGLSSMLFQPLYNNFSAGGRTCNASQVSFQPGESLLSLTGCRVDVIDDVIGPLEGIQQVATDLASIHPSLKRLLDGLQKFAQSLPQEDWPKFWRTTLGDQDGGNLDNIVRPAPEDLGKKAGVYFRNDPLPDDVMLDGPHFSRLMKWILPYESQLLLNLTERCFFTTKKGHMGIGPYRTKKGDIAVVLFGSTICFVLRPVGQEYELIGDAYVHGVMHGELLREHQEGRLASEVFTLR